MENNGYHYQPYLLRHHNHPLHQWPPQQPQQNHQLYDSFLPHHICHYQQQFQQGLIIYDQQQYQPDLLHQLQPSGQLFQQQHEQQQQQQQPVQGVIHYEGVRGVLDCIPLGYRFSPTDDELIIHYLRKKVLNHPLPENRIHEADIYDCTPAVLTRRYPWDVLHKENEWFFFTTLKPKHANGSRPSRKSAGDEGFWKPTGSDKVIFYRGSIIGYKKTLDFLLGGTPGRKTDWKMHEYRLEENCLKVQPRIKENYPRSRVVLCRIYLNTKHKDGASRETRNENLDRGVIINEAPMETGIC